MAAQAAVGQVQHEVGGAALAARDPAARGAGQHRRIAAPVEEDEALFAALQTLTEGAQQDAGQPVLQFLEPRVDALHGRQAGVGHRALAQREQRVARRRARIGRVRPALQRRRRRTEHDRNAAFARAEDGDVARRVAHAVLLLERGVVLLVDDDQPEVGQGGEDGEAGAEHDARRTVERRAPVARARRLGEFAVQAGQPASGKRAATRASSCGVRLISGTSSRTCGRRPARARRGAGRPRSCRCR
jgi:hypothetical protein